MNTCTHKHTDTQTDILTYRNYRPRCFENLPNTASPVKQYTNNEEQLPGTTVELSAQVHLLPGEKVPRAEVLPVPHRSQGDGGGEAAAGHPHVPPHVLAGAKGAGRLRVIYPKHPPEVETDFLAVLLKDGEGPLGEDREERCSRRGELGSADRQTRRSWHKVVITVGGD